MIKHLLFIVLISAVILLIMGCKEKSAPQYKAKYSEAQLVGEWILQDKENIPNAGSLGSDIECCLIDDTLIFDYNNNVISKTKRTNHYIKYYPEEKWGEHTIVKGTYKMENDTLLISLDKPNLVRTTFGQEPFSLHPTIYIDHGRIDNYYAVTDIKANSITIVNYLRKWDGGYNNINNKVYSYNRK